MKKYITTGLVALTLISMPAVFVSAQGSRAEEAKQRVAEKRELVKQRVEEKREAIKQRVEERKAEIQERVCERREATVQRVMPRLANSATTLKTTMDALYERVQGFYENGQLTVENYDELTENVDTAQTDAAVAIQLIDEYEFEFDCEVRGVGQQLDGFRDAVQDARGELKAYREALVTLISSLRAEVIANEETDSDTEEENEVEEAENENESESVENEKRRTRGENR